LFTYVLDLGAFTHYSPRRITGTVCQTPNASLLLELAELTAVMGNSQITIEVPEDELQRLLEIFGADRVADPDGAKALEEGFASSAIAEYLLMATGERNPTTVRDLRELRLKLLALHLPQQLPSDRQIAELFQLTPTQTRTLVSGTRARYRQELREVLAEVARQALRDATKVNNNMIRIVASDSLFAYLSELISSAAPPTKRTDASHQYDLTRATVKELCEALDLPIAEVKALPAAQRSAVPVRKGS